MSTSARLSSEKLPASLLLDSGGHALRMHLATGRRLGQWRVQTGERGLAGDSCAPGAKLPLNYVLLRLNAVPIGHRYPVLASGALDIREHLLANSAELTAAVVSARVTGIPGASAVAQVYFLDRAQLQCLDDAVSGAAHRVLHTLNGQQSVELPSGELLNGVYSYASGTGTSGAETPCYDQLVIAADGSLERFTVAVTPDDLERQGQPTVRLAPTALSGLDRPELVVVRPAHPDAAGTRLATVARAVPAAGVPARTVQADQLVRNAIGVEVGEQVTLAPATLSRSRWLDWAIGRPTYVTCRVQSADLTTVEREVALVDSLTLGLLGVSSGDEVVVEGVPDNGGPVPSVRVKAFQASEDVVQRRIDLSGGGLSCRFPSARDALGVFPDLPWVFLDSATRTALGLAGQKLGVVRIRPQRRYQFLKEIREMLLVLAVAFVGVAVAAEGVWLVVVPLLLGLLIVLVIGLRLRVRLAQRMRR